MIKTVKVHDYVSGKETAPGKKVLVDRLWPRGVKKEDLPGHWLKEVAPSPDLRKWFEDRKSTRLNSSHVAISYAVFCLKKKKSTTTARYVALRNARYSPKHARDVTHDRDTLAADTYAT